MQSFSFKVAMRPINVEDIVRWGVWLGLHAAPPAAHGGVRTSGTRQGGGRGGRRSAAPCSDCQPRPARNRAAAPAHRTTRRGSRPLSPPRAARLTVHESTLICTVRASAGACGAGAEHVIPICLLPPRQAPARRELRLLTAERASPVWSRRP